MTVVLRGAFAVHAPLFFFGSRERFLLAFIPLKLVNSPSKVAASIMPNSEEGKESSSSSSEGAVLRTVQTLKESLAKEWSKLEEEDAQQGGGDGPSSSSSSSNNNRNDEAVRDLLERLDECPVTLPILTETLVGAIVSKIKGHATVGHAAKALIKKWKAIAKREEEAAAGKKGGPAVAAATAKKGAATKRPSTTELERRESTSSLTADHSPDDYWSDLPSHRQTICQKLQLLLIPAKGSPKLPGIGAAAIKPLAAQRAAEVEAAIHTLFPTDPKAYSDKARSLAFNLKKNPDLCRQVLLGDDVTADELVSFTSEQLASDQTRKARAAEAQKVIDSKRLDWEQANEDKINEMCGIKGDLLKASLFTCGRCKSTKTTSTQKQTRSADEPSTCVCRRPEKTAGLSGRASVSVFSYHTSDTLVARCCLCLVQ